MGNQQDVSRFLTKNLERGIYSSALVISGLSFAAFALLGAVAHAQPYFSWDVAIARSIQKIGGVAPVMRLVSAPGYGWKGVALTGFTTLVLWLARHKWEAIFLPISAGIGELLHSTAKRLIGRPRPGKTLVAVSHHLSDPSFPSGHVVFYCSCFGFLFWVAYQARTHAPRLSRLGMILAAIPIILVGISRVYVGTHWPSDVLGGYLLAAAWLPIVFLTCRWAKERWPLDAKH